MPTGSGNNRYQCNNNNNNNKLSRETAKIPDRIPGNLIQKKTLSM
jgi:hypothetical protein